MKKAATRAAAARTRKRDARLERAGWRVVRVAGDMPVEEAVARIAAAVAG